MYFPTIDTILNLLTTGLFIFYMKKKLDENDEIKRTFFLNFDFFITTLDVYFQENLHFYTGDDKKEFMENTTKMNEFVIKNTELFVKTLVLTCQRLGKVIYFNTTIDEIESIDDNFETTEEVPQPIIFEEKYKEEYKNAQDTELGKERLEQLKNSILIENTPLGNVLMFYDSSRETFIYHSDSTIPYRYLEVVARKYVITNRCKKLYVDMEKEIKEAREKIEKKQKEEEELKQQMEEKNEKEPTAAPTKKSVFAKMKNYNKDNSLKSAGIPSDNKSVSKKIIPSSDNNSASKKETQLLKENANRYSYEGKMVNFSFLKKVEKKVVDKRYAMNFSDFKKMVMDKKK
jgi:hypothetical protein